MADKQVKTPADKTTSAAPKEDHVWEYISFKDDAGKAMGHWQASEAFQKLQPIVRTFGTDIYRNSAPNNVSIRDGFDRRDYEHFRPTEARPRRPKDVIYACNQAYKTNGIIRHVIDMMADFTAKGIDVVHEVPAIERFYKKLFHEKWNGPQLAERFANYLYRMGLVLPKSNNPQTITVPMEKKLKTKGEKTVIQEETVKRKVTLGFNCLNPNSVNLLSEDLAAFLGREGFLYGITIPKHIVNAVKYPKKASEKKIVAMLSPDIREAILSGETVLPVEPERLTPYFYKRDDWEAWPSPMIASILPDLNMLEKMKLADLAALDGAISSIRVWKLGSLEHKIMPPPGLMLRLADMLTNNVGGGVMDLVWGPDIELKETSTDAHRFLGSTKYTPVLQAIYAGLGLPISMFGGDSSSTGYTNNAMSLKTLIERILYGRMIVSSFFNAELAKVGAAMEFAKPARLVYDNILMDEATERRMLIDLYDRNLLDEVTVQEENGFDADIVASRRRREYANRKRGKVPQKAGPYTNDANLQSDLKKQFAGTGAYAPEQFGVELDEAKKGSKPPGEIAAKFKPAPTAPTPASSPAKPKGTPGKGRPGGQKDASKRKQKTVKPRTKAEFSTNLVVAENMLGRISSIVTPKYLKSLGKENLRQLTEKEANDFEHFKFSVLTKHELGEEITESTLGALLQKPLVADPAMNEQLKLTVKMYSDKNSKEPTFAELRRFQTSIFAMYKGADSDDDGSSEVGPDSPGDGMPPVLRTEEELEEFAGAVS